VFFLVDDMPLWLVSINTVGVPFNMTVLLLLKCCNIKRYIVCIEVVLFVFSL
jgi:hypothetical protein